MDRVEKRRAMGVIKRYLDYIYFDMVNKRLTAQVEYAQIENVDVLLDLGCSTGYNTDRIRTVLRPKQAIGLEFDPVAIQKAQEFDVSTVRHDLNQPFPLRSCFVDLAIAFDVLEHLVETWQFITEVYRVLKPGGYFLIDSPNLAAWHNIVTLVLGIQPTTGPHLISIADSDLKLVENMHRRDHNITINAKQAEVFSNSKMHRHLVVPTYWSLYRVLVKAGFNIEIGLGFGYYPFPPLISNLLCKVDVGHAHHYIIRAQKPTY